MGNLSLPERDILNPQIKFQVFFLGKQLICLACWLKPAGWVCSGTRNENGGMGSQWPREDRSNCGILLKLCLPKEGSSRPSNAKQVLDAAMCFFFIYFISLMHTGMLLITALLACLPPLCPHLWDVIGAERFHFEFLFFQVRLCLKKALKKELYSVLASLQRTPITVEGIAFKPLMTFKFMPTVCWSMKLNLLSPYRASEALVQ